MAGNHRFPAFPWHLHGLDLPGIFSLDGIMAIYGLEGAMEAAFRRIVTDDFHSWHAPTGSHSRTARCSTWAAPGCG